MLCDVLGVTVSDRTIVPFYGALLQFMQFGVKRVAISQISMPKVEIEVESSSIQTPNNPEEEKEGRNETNNEETMMKNFENTSSTNNST